MNEPRNESLEIICIHKRDHENIHERIIRVGIAGMGNIRIDIDQLIKYIERGVEFHVDDGKGNKVKVVVRVRAGKKYVQTEPDGENDLPLKK